MVRKSSPLWQNVQFTKDGRHYPTPDLHESELEAKSGADQWEDAATENNAKCMRTYGKPLEILDAINDRHLYWFSEYSHTLQLPAGKA
jgi:hypothetical protein